MAESEEKGAKRQRKAKKANAGNATLEAAKTAAKQSREQLKGAANKKLLAYHDFLTELLGRYAIGDMGFVPHVVDRGLLAIYLADDELTRTATSDAMELDLFNIMTRQLTLLGRYAPDAVDATREALIKLLKQYTAWAEVTQAAYTLWETNALLPASGDGLAKEVIVHRYGYYATSIAVFMRDTRVLPPLELFEGLAAATPRFVEVCSSGNDKLAHRYIQATRSIRAGLGALHGILDVRMATDGKENADIDEKLRTDAVQHLADAYTDFVDFVGSPEKLLVVRKAEMRAIKRKFIRLGVGDPKEPVALMMMCATARMAAFAFHEKWRGLEKDVPDTVYQELELTRRLADRLRWQLPEDDLVKATVDDVRKVYRTCFNNYVNNPEIKALAAASPFTNDVAPENLVDAILRDEAIWQKISQMRASEDGRNVRAADASDGDDE